MVANEGWSKAAVSPLFKLDSFLRKTTRFTGFSARESIYPLRVVFLLVATAS
jgi:hypothetical protein